MECAGDEPRRFDLVLLPELEKSVNADRRSKDTSRHVSWVRLVAIDGY